MNTDIQEEIIKNTVSDILKLLTIPAELSLKKQEDETYKAILETDNTGILIGYHGETLSALQMIVSLIAYKKTGTWIHLSLDVGDYREKREKQLAQMIGKIVEQVKTLGQPYCLPYLSANERKIVHLLLESDPDVMTESEGEGQNRRLFIKPKTEKEGIQKPNGES